MIQINNIVISHNALELIVDVQTDPNYNVTSMLLWNQDMYKNFDDKLDISYKLDQISNRESFSLTRDQAGVVNFEGIWFLEINSNSPSEEECSTCSPTQLVIVTNFNHLYRCLAAEANKIGSCIDNLFGSDSCCNPSEVNKIMTVHLLLESVKANLNMGEYVLAIEMYKKAMVLCKDCNPNELISPLPPCLTCN